MKIRERDLAKLSGRRLLGALVRVSTFTLMVLLCVLYSHSTYAQTQKLTATAPVNKTAIVGVLYRGQISVTGGTTPYKYSPEYGMTKVPGFTVNQDGLISWTPDRVGALPVGIRVIDGRGSVVMCSYNLIVSCPTITLSPPQKLLGYVGVSYNSGEIIVQGGTEPYMYTTWQGTTIGTCGLRFDPSNRAINGTPTKAGSFGVSLKVTDKNNCSKIFSFGIRISVDNIPPTANCTDLGGGRFRITVQDKESGLDAVPADCHGGLGVDYEGNPGEIQDGMTEPYSFVVKFRRRGDTCTFTAIDMKGNQGACSATYR